jgi:hypothetical protein
MVRTSWMRVCSCSSRYSAPFRFPPRISISSTPKLNTSDFTEKTPSMTNSGAMYPLHPNFRSVNWSMADYW